jgi:hypothetical protein
MVQSDMLNLFSKSSEDIAQDSEQSVSHAANPRPEGDALAVEQQSDLTSPQQISAPLDEVPNEVPNEVLSESSIQPKQKKT